MPPGKTRSIAADEVHYGVLSRTLKDRSFAFFYFRDKAATASMMESTPAEYVKAQGSDNQRKLRELKRAIISANLTPFVCRLCSLSAILLVWVPSSTDVRRTLRRFCHELQAAFPEFLQQTCEAQRVVILLDALNQFDLMPHAIGLRWLPTILPEGVRVILSTTEGPVLSR